MADQEAVGPQPALTAVVRFRRHCWQWLIAGLLLFAASLAYQVFADACPELRARIAETLGPGGRLGISVFAIGGTFLSLVMAALIRGEYVALGPDGIEVHRWGKPLTRMGWDEIERIIHAKRRRYTVQIHAHRERLVLSDRLQRFGRLVAILQRQAELYDIPWKDL